MLLLVACFIAESDVLKIPLTT